MEEVNCIVFAQQGLVTFRFAEAHEVYEMDVVFPDGDVHPIMVRSRWGPPAGHQNTPEDEGERST